VIEELPELVPAGRQAAFIGGGCAGLIHQRVADGARAGALGAGGRRDAVAVFGAAAFAQVIGAGRAPGAIGEVVAAAIERSEFWSAGGGRRRLARCSRRAGCVRLA
jgi:hypothetical protein